MRRVRSLAFADCGDGPVSTEPLFSLPFSEILRLTSERTAFAGGGAVSAMACASAASLVGMAARYAGESAVPALEETEAALGELRELADADAESFGQLLTAWRLPPDRPDRRERVASAALAACRVPLRVCQLGERIVEQATWLAAEGKRDLRGDAVTACYLAQAGVLSAARLVAINAAQGPDRSLPDEAGAIVARVRQVVEQMEAEEQ
jgi:formiminotetrahydrofolate cyclodeaminase